LEIRPLILLEEGILSVDDTVLDKPHSQEGKTDLVGYFYSGLHGKAVKGINLVTLFYGEIGGLRVPVNFRAVDKAEGKTKNELFREMVREVLGWGLAPAIVTADSWYSGVENLRFLRDQGLSFMIALEKNRFVSEQPGEHLRVENAALPESGKAMYLRHFGWASVFRTVDKNNDVRHYAAFDTRKKAHESRLERLPSSPSRALGHRELSSRHQATLLRRKVFRALQASHPQPSLL
jgi:SRSO17 transposase